jgi:hypothetical protein
VGDVGTVLITVAIMVPAVVAFTAAFGVPAWRNTAPSIGRRLRTTGAPVLARSGGLKPVWNPSREGLDAQIFERGEATYRLDADGTVHLEFRSKTGNIRHLTGPIPQRLQAGTPKARTVRKARRLAYALLLVQLVLVLVGAVVGSLAVSPNGRSGSTIVGALLGLLVGSLVAWLVGKLALFTAAYYQARNQEGDPERSR